MAFSNRPGTLNLEVILLTMNSWGKNARISSLRESFEEDVAEALADTRVSGTRKRGTWVKYDDLINSASHQDHVLLADRLLMRCYKNRRNLNGVSRYSSALKLVQDAVAELTKPDPISNQYIFKVISQEPSSFRVSGNSVFLDSVERKIAPADPKDSLEQHRLL